MPEDIVRHAFEAFQLDAENVPSITLRGGASIDSYSVPPPFDPDIDKPTQEAVVVELLDLLAFNAGSAYQELAMQVLEEYWIPNALYRERGSEG